MFAVEEPADRLELMEQSGLEQCLIRLDVGHHMLNIMI
jgi:hypothetical protein